MTDAGGTSRDTSPLSDAPASSVRAGGPPRWLLIALGIVAVAALAFAIGRFTTFTVAEQAAAPTTDSADAGFARDMQVHHAQAIDMGMTIYRKTSDPIIQVMAYDMVTGQSAQNGEMYSWLVRWGLPQSGGPLMAWMQDSHEHGGTGETLTDEEMRAQMGMATDAQLAALADATGTAADCLFLDLMTTHHRGAIEMIDGVLELGDDPRLLEVAQSMKDAQTFELDSMAASQVRLGCAVAAG